MQLSLYDPSSIEKKPSFLQPGTRMRRTTRISYVVNSRLVSELNPF